MCCFQVTLFSKSIPNQFRSGNNTETHTDTETDVETDTEPDIHTQTQTKPSKQASKQALPRKQASKYLISRFLQVSGVETPNTDTDTNRHNQVAVFRIH